MIFKVITATINVPMLEKVESRLKDIGVPGISISDTRGYGVYKNFFQRDWLDTHARIQIYAPESRVDEIVEAIMEAAYAGLEDDGIIAVGPVDALYRISDKEKLATDHF